IAPDAGGHDRLVEGVRRRLSSIGLATRSLGRNSMQPIHRACAAVVLLPLFAVPVHAQVSRLPLEVQQVLATVGPQWGSAIRENIDTTAAAFRPLLKAAPKDGVTVARNIAYGEDARQILDVYQPIWRSGAPVVIFIHGGAYVRGDKDAYGEMYG